VQDLSLSTTDGGIYDGQFRIPKTPCRAKNELVAPHISEVLASKTLRKSQIKFEEISNV